jgi:hypothetical protein
MAAASCQCRVPTPMRDSRNMLRAMTAAPATGKIFVLSAIVVGRYQRRLMVSTAAAVPATASALSRRCFCALR